MATVPTDYTIGDQCVIGYAVNGDNGGSTEGGSAGTFVYVRPNIDSVSFRPGLPDQIEVDNMSIYEDQQESGLNIFSGSFTVPLSYSSEEKILQLMSGGAISTTGASAPYSHAMALADQLLFGGLKLWTNSQRGTGTLWTLTDIVLPSIEISIEVAGLCQLMVNWIAKGGSSATAASPSVTALERARWKRTAITLGSNTYCPRSMNLKIERALTEDDGGLCTALAGGLASISRAGKTKTTLTMDIGTDSVLEAIAQAPDTAVGSTALNTIILNNGASAAAEREWKVVLGEAFPMALDRSMGNYGKEMATRAFKIIDSAPFAFTTKNALASIA